MIMSTRKDQRQWAREYAIIPNKNKNEHFQTRTFAHMYYMHTSIVALATAVWKKDQLLWRLARVKAVTVDHPAFQALAVLQARENHRILTNSPPGDS